MSAQKHSLAVRFLPSLTDAAFFMPLVLLFGSMGGARTLLHDGDTGWHIRAGEWMLQNGRVPDRDFFSFTKPGEPWYAWEWLWDVSFAWLHQHWGMAAVLLASTFVLSLTFGLLFRLVRRKCDHDIIAIAITLLAAAGASMHWLARPHLFTLLFIVIFYSLLERVRDGQTRWLWWLPPLMVLWTNLHGGFLAGIMLVLAYAAGEMAAWLVEAEKENRQAALARSKPFLLTALGCAAATFINPYGYRLHVHIYGYLTDSYHFQNIAEFLPTNFQHPVAIFYELMFFLVAVTAYIALRRKEFTYALLLVVWGHFALFSRRNIPILMIVAAPVVALQLREWLDGLRGAALAGWVRRGLVAFQDQAAGFGAIDRIPRFHLVSLAALLFITAMFYAPAPLPAFRAEYDAKRYPAGALETLRRPPAARHVFTHDEWGDYLIYKLYPATKVFIDGRSDFYGAAMGNALMDILNLKHGWDAKLDSYRVDAILLPVDLPMAGALKESRRWRPVYDDGVAIVFEPAGPKMAPAAEKASTTQISGTDRDRKPARSENLTDMNPNRRRIT
ncbi:MAG: hypothetical protein AAB225_06470 [Acidobacteriota bacterium]